ncbi:hypothetical protein ABPG74_003619 [Tetrahymena malaccensis]
MNQDFLVLQEFREDGRKKNELRKVECILGFDQTVEGSCKLIQGLTEIVCLIKGPHNKSTRRESEGFLNVQYNVAPFSGTDRRKISKFDKDWNEFTENLRVSFESVILAEQLGSGEIDIIVSVIQSDGSAKSSIFNAISLALMDAGIPMKDFTVSSTAISMNNEILLDATYQEQKKASAELIISYLPRSDQVDFMEMKSSKISQQDTKEMCKIAVDGCKQMYQILRTFVMESSVKTLLSTR